MLLTVNFLEDSIDTKTKEDSMQRQILVSKLKSLNDHLAALLQKKIRIDLEIRRTKNKLSKLKSQSQTYVKTRVQLEGINSDGLLSQEQTDLLLEKVGNKTFEELKALDYQIDRSEELQSEVDQLPLFE